MNGTRLLTVGALDLGEKPAVISAIVKAYLTDLMRAIVNDAMDVRAGSGICRGPRNVLEHLYWALPIGITVEGANILTRSMIIYGQGAIRCHPWVGKEMKAVEKKDVAAFDHAFFKHVNFVFANAARAFFRGVLGPLLLYTPGPAKVRRYFRRLGFFSAGFALTSDVAMATLGGKLKRKEKISGRLADMLAWMYLACGALKRYVDQGQNPIDYPFLCWACEHSLYKVQTALNEILENLPSRPAAWILRRIVLPFGPRLRPPSDNLGAEVARGLLEDRQAWINMTSDIFVPRSDDMGLGRLEAALDKAVQAILVETKIRDAVRAGKLDRAPGDALVTEALKHGVINTDEATKLKVADEARNEVIQVDAFTPEEYRALHG